MKNILYYISGHGYGHSTRSIEIIRQLTTIYPDVFVHIKTDAPQWLFQSGLNGNYQYHHLRHDIGVVQTDSFSVDKVTTFRMYGELIKEKSKLIEQELMFVHANHIDLIVGDISPLAFEIAHASGLPSVAVGNFSWDWIYSAWLEEYPEYKYVVGDISQAYAKADVLLRLPFYGNMSVFSPIEDVPIVGRKANHSREDTRRQIGLSMENRRIVLLGLRRQDLEGVDWSKVKSMDDTLFVSFSGDYPITNFVKLPPECVLYQDLVNAVDAILSKPGYGIVAECFINRTPLLYVPRSDFLEDIVLRQSLEEYSVAQLLPFMDFRDGNWSHHLNELGQNNSKWAALDTNGGEIVAGKIYQMLSA